ncbi:AAA family ATPase [Amycolatopsis lurida]
MSEVQRYLIAAGTTRYPLRGELGDRPELGAEIDRVVRLFTARGFDYKAVRGFGADLELGELRAQLRSFLTSHKRKSDDIVVFYYTGHGEVDDSGEFLFSLPDTTEDLVGTGLPASELARWLVVGTRVQRLLVVLDTCHGGIAGSELASRTMAALGRLRAVADRPQFAVMAATRPYEQALAGTFTQAMERAIRHRASGGHEPRFLPLDAVVDLINADPAKAPSQHAQLLSHGEAAAEFLPNPRYDQWLHGLDLRTQLDREQRKEREREFAEHVLPRAQGLDAPQEGLWLFTGRYALLRDLADWLRDIERDGRSRVVTGDPGSGKSAVLARLTVLASPEHRGKIPRVDQLPPQTVPPRDSVDVFIHARGQTGDQILAGLCAAANVEAERAGQFLASLAKRTRPLVAVIDALDEATNPDQLVEQVLAPLVRGGPQANLRLLLGTRKHLLHRLGGPLERLDLDADRYADPASVRTYVHRCLVDLVPESPYTHAPEEFVDAVAHAVATAAGHSFLVALITGRSLAMRAQVANPYDDEWRAGLPRLAAEAMRLDLDQRLGAHATRARDLMRPLAYALGSGLPWEDIWAPMASRIAGGQRYTNADLDWLIREAGFYVVEALEGARSVYRLYHEALAEHLRDSDDQPSVQACIVEFLTGRTPTRGGRPDWSRTHPYARLHLATHATSAGALDDLVVDPDYLLHADRAQLLAALPETRAPQARAAAQAYRRTVRHLRGKPAYEHGAYLELAAYCYQASALAGSIAETWSWLPWRTRWAQWASRGQESILYGHKDRVRALATGDLHDQPIIVSGSSDGTLRIWDLVSGTPIGQPLSGHVGEVHAVAFGHVDHVPVIASGGADRVIWVWDLATNLPIGPMLSGHNHTIRALALGELDGHSIVVSGSYDNTVRAWNLTTGEQIGSPLIGHYGGITAVAIAKISWRPLVVSGAYDGTIRVWDLLSGNLAAVLHDPGYSEVTALTVVQRNNRTLIIASGLRGRISTWDLATRVQVGTPILNHGNPAWALVAGEFDSRLVAFSGHGDNTVRTWDIDAGTPIETPLPRHQPAVQALALGQLDGRPLVISGGGDNTVRIWDLALDGLDSSSLSTHLRGLRCVAVGSNGQQPVVITGGEDRAIRVWDLATGEPLGQPLTGHVASVHVVGCAQLGESPVIISGGADGTVKVWNLQDGVPIRSILGHTAAVRAVATVEIKGQIRVVSGDNNNTVKVWDITTGQVTNTLDGFLYPELAVAIGRASGTMTWLDEGDKPVWGPRTLIKAKQSKQTDGKPSVSIFTTFNGVRVALTGDKTGTLRVWQLLPGKPGLRGLLLRPRRRLLKQIRGQQPISAIAHQEGSPLAIARLNTIELRELDQIRQVVQLDAEVQALCYCGPGTLVVATQQGLVMLRFNSG